MTDSFVTGVTGFLGRHVAARLASRSESDRLWCLVRADDPAHGRERLQRSIGRAVGPERAAALMPRIEALPGDLTLPNLGLSPHDLESVVTRCTAFLHSAADVRFDQDLDDARRRNVYGTQQVVAVAREAAKRGQLDRLDWVGTAFVAGLRTDLVGEDELEHTAGHKNNYEKSKYEAEMWLRSQCEDLPVTVFRPSIIVGESKSGATSNFGMMYWPIQLYARGWWRTIVGRPTTRVDIVPVDFVADAIEVLSRPAAAVNTTYHLAAGEGHRTIEQLAAICERYFDAKRAKYIDPQFFMRWVRPILNLFLWGKRGRVLKDGGAFFVPYFSDNPTFDTTRTRTALGASGVAVPTVEDYFETLMDYCVRTDFGKRALNEGDPETDATTAA